MEDDLKSLKVEYLSNHWLDLTQLQILKYFKWIQPPTEDDLKILKVELFIFHNGNFIENLKELSIVAQLV